MFLRFVLLPALFELGCDVCSVGPFWSNYLLPVRPLPRYQKRGQWGLEGPSLEGGGSALPPVTGGEARADSTNDQYWKESSRGERETQTGSVRSRRLKKDKKSKKNPWQKPSFWLPKWLPFRTWGFPEKRPMKNRPFHAAKSSLRGQHLGKVGQTQRSSLEMRDVFYVSRLCHALSSRRSRVQELHWDPRESASLEGGEVGGGPWKAAPGWVGTAELWAERAAWPARVLPLHNLVRAGALQEGMLTLGMQAALALGSRPGFEPDWPSVTLSKLPSPLSFTSLLVKCWQYLVFIQHWMHVFLSTYYVLAARNRKMSRWQDACPQRPLTLLEKVDWWTNNANPVR